jgi:hypothetical protein
MANNTIIFKNKFTGEARVAPVGFSWTVFFFGFFPPLFRSDWKWAIIMLLCALITAGLSTLVFIFVYNRLYIKDLVNNGFTASGVERGTIANMELRLGFRIA